MKFLSVVVFKLFVLVSVILTFDERWDSHTTKSKELVGGVVPKDSGLQFTAFVVPLTIATN